MKRILLVLSAITLASQGFSQGGDWTNTQSLVSVDDCWNEEAGDPPTNKTPCADDLLETDSNGYLVNAEKAVITSLGSPYNGNFTAENPVTSPEKNEFDADASDLAPQDLEADCEAVIDTATDITDCVYQVLNTFDKDGRPLHYGWRIRWRQNGNWWTRDIIIRHIALVLLHGFCGTNGRIRKVLKWSSTLPDICGQCSEKFSAGVCRTACNIIDTYGCPKPSSSATPTPPAPVCNSTGVLDPSTICSEDGSACSVFNADCSNFCLAQVDSMKADPANGCKK